MMGRVSLISAHLKSVPVFMLARLNGTQSRHSMVNDAEANTDHGFGHTPGEEIFRVSSMAAQLAACL
jgi:hypothetical protein